MEIDSIDLLNMIPKSEIIEYIINKDLTEDEELTLSGVISDTTLINTLVDDIIPYATDDIIQKLYTILSNNGFNGNNEIIVFKPKLLIQYIVAKYCIDNINDIKLEDLEEIINNK